MTVELAAPESVQATSYVLQIASRIRAAREAAGLNQQELSEKFGFNDRQSLSAIETGERAVSPQEMIRMAKLLGKPLEFFTDPYIVTEVQAFSYRASSNSDDIAAFEHTAHKLISADRRFKKLLGEPGIPFGNRLKAITKQSTLQMAAVAGEDTGKTLNLGCPPADTLRDAVQAQLRINVFYVDAPRGISGAACHLPDGDYVLVNRREPSYRRNFNLGHEVFHLLTWDEMPPDRVDLVSQSDDRPKSEKMADNFSSGILLPADQVHSRWMQKPEATAVTSWVLTLAHEYRVSGEAMYWRLVNLGLVSKTAPIGKLSRADESATGGLPLLYNTEFVRRLHKVLTHGFVSVRKAASVLECTPKSLEDLVEAYGHEVSF